TQFAPDNARLTSFSGFVRVGHDEFKVRVRSITYDNSSSTRMCFDTAQLDVEPRLAAILASQQDTLKIRLAQSSSLESFIKELEELVAICAPVTTLQPALPSAAYYTHLMAELDAIGWNHLLELSDDLRSLELQTHDAAKRKHAIRLQLPVEYPPRSAPVCFVDAPEPFELVWDPQEASAYGGGCCYMLKEVLQQFDAFLSKFQSFWDVLDDLDTKTCVLEPHRPTRATARRRIALQKHASLQIEVNPEHPRAICELSFFGNDATVGSLREKWSEGVFQWDETLPLRDNLESILDVEFPSPTHTQADEFAIECGICYCYRLEMDAPSSEETTTATTAKRPHAAQPRTLIPDKLCENSKCNRPFHEKCLFDWLKALPTARQSFNTVFGECPYCREAISAKFLP
uniref:RING-type domain-containing protein n=1 Tax=Globisporangium ultimum (strain ATCC 200006 / CBS 805.95 / DAOM BR144) TaxID=431595 RepID=K3X2N1_GLOUD